MDTFFYKTFPKGVIRVIEEDAEDYLQSQWTINLRKLPVGGIRYGLRLSTRGRVLADSFFLRIGEEEFILLSKDCDGAELNSLLEENIVADEVEFIDESKNWELITLLEDEKESNSKFKEIKKPEKGEFVTFKDGYFFEDFRISPGVFSLLRPIQDEIPDELSRSEENFNLLEMKRIKAGLVSVPAEIGPDDLPQEGRLERDAIDFDKGCYLGQEVMARIHAMGRVRRLAFPVIWNGTELPAFPCPLFYGDKKKGILKSLHQVNAGESIGIALIHESALDNLKSEGLTIQGITDGRIQMA
jgi:hypothetical protein